MESRWPAVSTEAKNVIRRGAERTLDLRTELLDEISSAVRPDGPAHPFATDPVLVERGQRTNSSNLLHWATANVQRPGERVPANLSRDVLASSRDTVRRGLDETALEAWRIGQQVAWRRWMDICFECTSDAEVLREVLSVTSLSMSTFADDTIAAITDVIRHEVRELAHGTHAERLATVTLLLEGAPMARSTAEAKLGYALTGHHVAAIVWGPPEVGGESLELAAESLLRISGAPRRLTVLPAGSMLWLWLPISHLPPSADLESALAVAPGTRIALGRAKPHLDGFRTSHLEAAEVQRMMSRQATARPVGSYADVQLVTLLSRDMGQVNQFIADTLGALATAEPELRLTLRAYLAERCNAARVAERLHTHRNTIIRRLVRCDELLARPLPANAVSVGAALEVLAWLDGHD